MSDNKTTPKHVNTITINTDASFYSEYKVGGYAFYIISDLFKITKGGRFKGHPYDPTEAEMMCIGNAFATLLSQKELPTCKFLIINTDSKHGLQKIKNCDGPTAKKVNKLWQKLITRVGSKVNRFRHVKAHSGINDARSYVNEWCDAEAKRWSRKALAEAKAKAIETRKEASNV